MTKIFHLFVPYMSQNFPFLLVPAEKIWSQQRKSSVFRLKVQQSATLKAPHHSSTEFQIEAEPATFGKRGYFGGFEANMVSLGLLERQESPLPESYFVRRAPQERARDRRAEQHEIFIFNRTKEK
jgi:hypothetical protein